MSKQIDYSKGIYDARQLGAGRMFILGVQHMFAMFGATVLVPLIFTPQTSESLSVTARMAVVTESVLPIRTVQPGPMVTAGADVEEAKLPYR